MYSSRFLYAYLFYIYSRIIYFESITRTPFLHNEMVITDNEISQNIYSQTSSVKFITFTSFFVELTSLYYYIYAQISGRAGYINLGMPSHSLHSSRKPCRAITGEKTCKRLVTVCVHFHTFVIKRETVIDFIMHLYRSVCCLQSSGYRYYTFTCHCSSSLSFFIIFIVSIFLNVVVYSSYFK